MSNWKVCVTVFDPEGHATYDRRELKQEDYIADLSDKDELGNMLINAAAFSAMDTARRALADWFGRGKE